MMDYLCGKFGNCSFSRFGSIMRTNRHTDPQTDADECFTPATLVSTSKYQSEQSKPLICAYVIFPMSKRVAYN